jgi:hypothetical protein
MAADDTSWPMDLPAPGIVEVSRLQYVESIIRA